MVARGCNQGSFNPVLHGEVVTINNFAGTLQARNIRLADVGGSYDLYTTGESCPMCMAAIMFAGFDSVFFGSSSQTLSRYYSQVRITSRELAGLWSPCPGGETVVRTRVVGGVLEEATDALFREFGRQFCEPPAGPAG